MKPFQTTFVPLEVPSDGHGQDNFHDFGRLDAREPQFQPACRAIDGHACDFDGDKQQHANQVHRQRNLCGITRLERGDKPQQCKADNRMQGFVFKLAEILPVRRIEQKQAHNVDGEHGEKQPRVYRSRYGALDFCPHSNRFIHDLLPPVSDRRLFGIWSAVGVVCGVVAVRAFRLRRGRLKTAAA